MIRAAVISTASQYDGEVFAHIAPADSEVIYADKASDTKANQAWLRARGIRNGILKKEAHHLHLTAEDRENNQQKGRGRRHIERIFAHLKKWQHYRRVRYLGLARNQLELTLKGGGLQPQTAGGHPGHAQRVENASRKKINERMKTKNLDECDESKSIFASAACRRHHPFSKITPFADISEGVESLRAQRRCNRVAVENIWDG